MSHEPTPGLRNACASCGRPVARYDGMLQHKRGRKPVGWENVRGRAANYRGPRRALSLDEQLEVGRAIRAARLEHKSHAMALELAARYGVSSRTIWRYVGLIAVPVGLEQLRVRLSPVGRGTRPDPDTGRYDDAARGHRPSSRASRMTRTLTLAFGVLFLVSCTTPSPAALPVSPPDAQPSGVPHYVSGPVASHPAGPDVGATRGGTPPPHPEVGTALVVYRGTATWYCSDGRDGSPRSPCTAGYGPDDLVAAIDRKDSEFRKGDRVLVTFGDRRVVVTVVDVCRCADARVIDLTIGAFEWLAPWGSGVLSVTLQAAPELPETDREEQTP